jgi:hypothetical protein
VVGCTRQCDDVARLGPVWWWALALLVANDHVLKGRGWLPPALTGKLSDFAGLVVAPVLLAVALRLRSRRLRLAAVGSVAVGFAALKLFPSAAAAFEVALGALGLPCAVVPDATDLVAFAVLPLSYALTRPRPAPREPEAARRSEWALRAGVLFGSAACVATSIAPGSSGVGTVISTSPETLQLTLHVPAAPVDCGALESDAASALAATPFEPAECWPLSPRGTIPLQTAFDDDCGALVVRGPGLEPTALYWTNLPEHPLAPGTSTSDTTVYLHRIGDTLYVEPAPLIPAVAFTGTLEGAVCPIRP